MNFRTQVFRLIDLLGINELLRIINRKKVAILWYHGICDDNFDLSKGYDDRFITISSFKEQMEYLKNKGYAFINMTEFVNTVKNKGAFNKNVILTFDDGLRNVIKNAYPIMKEYNAKGCLYVVSDITGSDTLLWSDYVEAEVRSQKQGSFLFDFKDKKYSYPLTDEKSYKKAIKDIKDKLRTVTNKEMQEYLKQFLDNEKGYLPEELSPARWQEIKELDADVLEIGSHTRTHPNCANLTDDIEFENEILQSRRDIENATGRKVEHFCYPAGSYNDAVINKVKTSGYQSAVTVERGLAGSNSNMYRLRRIDAFASMPIFKSRVSGCYGVLRFFWTLFRKRQ
jgi:peptidoglycan/xylan/chitin deacetylase (PgdA/CDA1 family)